MENKKTLYLDTSILIHIAKFPDFGKEIHKFIEQKGYVLVLGVMNLIEIYRWEKYWHSIALFISSSPFMIAEIPEIITKAEVEHYPHEISLPIAFDTSKFTYTPDQLTEAIELNLTGKISDFEKEYRKLYRSVWKSFANTKVSPDNGKTYTESEIKALFTVDVMVWLYSAGHKIFLQNEVSAKREINIECFKSIYLPLLAIFVEYSVIKKTGKPSDVGDFFQFSIIPYVSLSVLDKERNSLINYINRQNLFSQRLFTYNQKEFREMLASL